MLQAIYIVLQREKKERKKRLCESKPRWKSKPESYQGPSDYRVATNYANHNTIFKVKTNQKIVASSNFPIILSCFKNKQKTNYPKQPWLLC